VINGAEILALELLADFLQKSPNALFGVVLDGVHVILDHLLAILLDQ
jgi:hypothetical protein